MLQCVVLNISHTITFPRSLFFGVINYINHWISKPKRLTHFVPNLTKTYDEVLHDNHCDFAHYMITNGYLFYESKLCILNTSRCGFLLWALHAGIFLVIWARIRPPLLLLNPIFWALLTQGCGLSCVSESNLPAYESQDAKHQLVYSLTCPKLPVKTLTWTLAQLLPNYLRS